VAPLGVLKALNEPTPGMRSEASAMGFWKLPGGQTVSPVMQIFTIQDWFDGKLPKLPDTSGTLKDAQRLIRALERQAKMPGMG